MSRNRPRRSGITLIEVLVVLGIVAILFSLLLAGVMKAREAALRAASTNNIRELGHATQAFAAINRTRLPSLDGDLHSANRGLSLFAAIFPYVQGKDGAEAPDAVLAKLCVSPADPTVAGALADGLPVSSYGANAMVFNKNARLPGTITDGTSHTIAFAEHYAMCGGVPVMYDLLYPNLGGAPHRGSFADAICLDIVPTTTGPPPTSTGCGVTFQAAPRLKDCDPHVAQTPHRSGMIVGVADGSVRIIAPDVDETTYWAMVTPAGGEIMRPDW